MLIKQVSIITSANSISLRMVSCQNIDIAEGSNDYSDDDILLNGFAEP